MSATTWTIITERNSDDSLDIHHLSLLWPILRSISTSYPSSDPSFTRYPPAIPPLTHPSLVIHQLSLLWPILHSISASYPSSDPSFAQYPPAIPPLTHPSLSSLPQISPIAATRLLIWLAFKWSSCTHLPCHLSCHLPAHPSLHPSVHSSVDLATQPAIGPLTHGESRAEPIGFPPLVHRIIRWSLEGPAAYPDPSEFCDGPSRMGPSMTLPGHFLSTILGPGWQAQGTRTHLITAASIYADTNTAAAWQRGNVQSQLAPHGLTTAAH